MKCPIDDTELTMAERQGIEIDYCPKCRGVWLDRGELDKIIQRSGSEDEPRSQYGQPRQQREDAIQRSYGDDRPYSHGKKKKSLLGEIFDF